MNWKQLLSNKRFGLENLHEARKEDRTEFQRDYDRLIFSAPFRRLQNKTQVFPLPGSIFVHNRLTHSLEVSCVGRSLGNKIASELLKLHPELHDTHISEIGSIVLLSVIREKRPSARIFPKEKDGPYKHIFQQRNGMTSLTSKEMPTHSACSPTSFRDDVPVVLY